MSLPALFVSHGGPDVLISGSPAPEAWRALARRLPLPRAILVMSAHHLAPGPRVGSAGHWRTVHDFGGFPAELYRLQYPATSGEGLADEVGAALTAAGIAWLPGPEDGLDHGAWVPLLAMYPQARVPVVTLATLPQQDACTHYRLGEAVAGLRDAGWLVLGSGSLTHNLYALGHPGMPPQPWAQAFADWMAERLAAGEVEALLDWQHQAPFARENHPTAEHLLPLFFALGAGGGTAGQALHRGIEYAAIAMDAWQFGGIRA